MAADFASNKKRNVEMFVQVINYIPYKLLLASCLFPSRPTGVQRNLPAHLFVQGHAIREMRSSCVCDSLLQAIYSIQRPWTITG